MAASATLTNLSLLKSGQTQREFISGGFERTISPLLDNAIQVLSQWSDDLTREFTDVVYDQMLRDPAVSASVEILKSLILSEPVRVVSKVQDKKSPEYVKAKEIADFVDRQIQDMNRPAEVAVYEMLEAIAYGSSLAEIVLEEADDPILKRPVLRLKDVKTKARRNYGIIVDRYFNVLGAINREWGYSAPGIYTGSTAPDPSRAIPREKLVILTFGSKYGDPRGVSMIRPAWNSYFLKAQVWPQYLKFLVQFASPSLVGFTPENDSEPIEAINDDGTKKLNEDGTVAEVTPEEQMLETLLGFQGGTVAVLKGGSKLDVLWSQGGGEAFSKAVELFDRQIAMAILKTHRTLLESKNSSKADSESAADITDVFVAHLKDVVSGVLTKDLAYQLVKLNFGPDDARQYCPTVTVKGVPKQDFSKAAGAVAQLWTAKYLHPSQVQETDALIGLPERDMDDFLEGLAQEEELRQIDQIERMKLLNPGAGTATKPGEESKPGTED